MLTSSTAFTHGFGAILSIFNRIQV